MFLSHSRSIGGLLIAKRHLGLSGLAGGNLRRAIYFGGGWEDIRLECPCAWGGVEIEADGTLIGGNGKGMVVLDRDGKRRSSFPEPAYASQITWNQHANLLAAIALDQQAKHFLLEYWPFGTQSFTAVEHFEQTAGLMPAISWSPDGAAITYSKAGRVFIYRLADQQAAAIALGENPGWSPDGNYIAFRSPDKRLSLLRVREERPRTLIPSIQIVRGVRWSPDSQFILVTVLRPSSNSEDETQFLIYRLSDGRTLRTDALSGRTTEDRVFWVVGMR